MREKQREIERISEKKPIRVVNLGMLLSMSDRGSKVLLKMKVKTPQLLLKVGTYKLKIDFIRDASIYSSCVQTSSIYLTAAFKMR